MRQGPAPVLTRWARVDVGPFHFGQRPPPAAASTEAPATWAAWVPTMFAKYTRAGFAARHVLYWEWLWPITPESDPEPFVGIWPRGGAKSTSAELGTVALGVRGARRYALYVRDTQDRADDSVSNIGRMLESEQIARYYPAFSERAVTKFGSSQGWRRNRLRTRGGFTVDALGLDVAARGVKLDDQRPDLIVFDDIDARHDSPETTARKIATITDSLLPAGTPNACVIAIQNLIIGTGVFAQLANGKAGFLARRIVSGPEPALYDMETDKEVNPVTGVVRTIITGGRPSWAGQGIRECQMLLDKIALPAFRREAQHNVTDREGALWSTAILNARRVAKAPLLKRIVIAVDPSGGGDEIGIVAAGLGYDDRAYVLNDKTAKGLLGPAYWGRATTDLYHDLQADLVAGEINFGGDMVKANIAVADPHVPFKMLHASRGKAQRAEPVAALYGDPDDIEGDPGRVSHVGDFPELEAEMTGWKPGDNWSPNRMDAAVWCLTELMLGGAEPDDTLDSIPSESYLDL